MTTEEEKFYKLLDEVNGKCFEKFEDLAKCIEDESFSSKCPKQLQNLKTCLKSSLDEKKLTNPKAQKVFFEQLDDALLEKDSITKQLQDQNENLRFFLSRHRLMTYFCNDYKTWFEDSKFQAKCIDHSINSVALYVENFDKMKSKNIKKCIQEKLPNTGNLYSMDNIIQAFKDCGKIDDIEIFINKERGGDH